METKTTNGLTQTYSKQAIPSPEDRVRAMKPMTPNTQSVCGERFNKHVNMVCNLEKGHSHMHHFEPVAEPASTGEPKPEIDICAELRKGLAAARPSEPSAPTLERQVCGMSVDDKGTECQKKPLHNGRCSVHPEPTTPKTGYCPYHGEKLLPIFGGQWNGCPKCPRDADGFTPAAPQTSAEHCKYCGQLEIAHFGIPRYCYPYKHPDWKEDLVFTFVQPVSGDAPDMNDPRYCGACKHIHPPHEVDCRCYCDKVSCPECGPRIAARVMADPAPSPTPSVSTPHFDAPMLIERLHRCVGIAEVEDAISEGEREHLDEFLNSLAKLAAPSVAGTQPTPEERELLLSQFFPQGTPQVEDIAQQFVHIVFPSMDADCARRYIQEGAALLREHGVGAPAQPGPQTRFDDFDDANHPCNKWWQEHGQFMMSGGGRREFIWACRGWIAREQLAEGVEVTGESMHESKPAPAQGTPEPPKVDMPQLIAQEILDDAFKPGGCCYRLNFTKMKAIIKKHWLRPYFPPASQTPQSLDFHTWLTRVHGFKVGSARNSYKEADLEAAWNAGISHRPEVIGAKPLCLDCHGAGIINCSHFDNCRGKWVYVATPASTARTDGWVDAKVRLPKAPETNDDPEFVYVKWTEAARWSGDEDEDNPRSASGYDTCLIAYLLENPKLISHWRELPAAPGSVPQASAQPGDAPQKEKP